MDTTEASYKFEDALLVIFMVLSYNEHQEDEDKNSLLAKQYTDERMVWCTTTNMNVISAVTN